MAEHPEVELLLGALAEANVMAVSRVWDDDHAEWNDFDLVVVRACWDYHWRHVDFLDWARSVPRLANPYSTLRWNIDKRYLSDLQTNSVRIVPTVWDLSTIADLPDVGDWIVKPAVSAGSADVVRVSSRSELARRVNALAASGRTPIVQQYVREIEYYGEISLVYIGGDRSHFVIRSSMPGYEDMCQSVNLSSKSSVAMPYPYSNAWEVGDSVLDLACTLSGAQGALLYGRVDLVATSELDLLILEAEMIEPSLFLNYSHGAPQRFASAIVNYIERAPA